VVYAPNGTDPLPNVTVYIPNAPVDAFPAEVSCPVVGALPSGVSLTATPAAVGTTTAVDGSFTISNVPVGNGIPIVAVSGRWRVQSTVNTTACTTTVMNLSMPLNHLQGDIPLIAIATGEADAVECVLLKMGINQSEFTDPGLGGRINLFGGGTNGQGAGVTLDSHTPTQDSLMSSSTTLNQYDLLMLPCEGGPFAKPDSELLNLISFANDGGRVYTSHFGYSWMYNNPPFSGVANWIGGTASNSVAPDPGVATVDTSFTAGLTLAQWLQLPSIGATTTEGQMTISTLRKDTNGVIAPTQSWLTLNNSSYDNPVMQFVFDTPIPSVAVPTPNQCGRVLYNEYHVENASIKAGTIFPSECDLSAAMTPQEKLLEYMLFELTSEGGQPSLAPMTQDFGSEAVGYPSAPQTFTWTNNSSFAAQVTSAMIGGTNAADFSITSPPCGSVAGGASCPITVVFTPSLLGTESATLNVLSAGNQLSATLTGTGVPGFTLTPATLSFGNQDVGFTSSPPKTLTLTSLVPVPLAVPMFTTTGEYSVSTAACGSTLAALASCPIGVSFKPAATGPLSGTTGVNSTNLLYSGLNATLSGNGVDFSISLNPTGGSVAAGDGTTTTATVTPIAGYSSPVTLSCTVAAGAAATVCSLSSATLTLTSTAAATTVVSIGTTSQYTLIGYSGYGGRGLLWLLAVASGGLLWRRRMLTPVLLGGLLLVLLGGLTSCTGKLPAENAAWTAPGNYTVTVTATDGQLIHSAMYSLTVTAK
jgi:hypothetical protein